ncbi:MAG TPA: excinuclease ABC subunit UvrA, partial [Patescibacteria group bacterium]|nr:excinuclease ABC subunit UvrA [Patescibacteria group bacterium]
MSKNKQQEYIIIKGAKEHNLKNIDVNIPINRLVVITGLSGSGKSTLAFDTIYAEGQRRYVESLSAYARQFLGIMNKPDIESIKGLSPAISIEQKTTHSNPRSTVGTVTEIYDYLRLLFARVGTPHCPDCGKPITSQSAESIVSALLNEEVGTRLQILAPVIRGKKGTYETLFRELNKKGYSKIRVNGKMYDLDDDKIKLEKYKKHNIEVVVDRQVITTKSKSRLTESIETALREADGVVQIMIESGKEKNGDIKWREILFSQHLACTECGLSFDQLQPRMFSFNSPFGACEKCHGLGTDYEFDPELVIPDRSLALSDGAVAPWKSKFEGWRIQMMAAVAKKYRFSMNVPVSELSPKALDIILHGSDKKIKFQYRAKTTNGYWEYSNYFEGVIPQLQRYYKQTDSEERRDDIKKYMRAQPCKSCHGQRLKPMTLAVKIGEYNIIELTGISITRTKNFFEQEIEKSLSQQQKEIARMILKEINSRLDFLINVGLDYLTLSRESGTLSGGEAQRIRLATQIGSELRGVLYILDEPSIGLHQRDNEKLIQTLQKLRDLGNTVLVVEHDEDTILAADWVIDIGPGAGIHGGRIVSEGSPKHIVNDKSSLTGQYLSGKKEITVPHGRRAPKGFLKVLGASEHNLKDIDVSIPLGVFTCITGVSGSGKSTLVNEILYKSVSKKLHKSFVVPGKHKDVIGIEQIDKIIEVDQSPIGRTPRSNPATYIKVFDEIRNIFASVPDSKIRGYKPGRFSFNVSDGRCQNCDGDGVIKIEMHFLPDVYVECEKCKGKRYNEETLQILYKDKTIAEVLDMTVEEAFEFFRAMPAIKKKLETLFEVGLGYIKLGQSATTLSGGEAQRVKLTLELAKRDT